MSRHGQKRARGGANPSPIVSFIVLDDGPEQLLGRAFSPNRQAIHMSQHRFLRAISQLCQCVMGRGQRAIPAFKIERRLVQMLLHNVRNGRPGKLASGPGGVPCRLHGLDSAWSIKTLFRNFTSSSIGHDARNVMENRSSSGSISSVSATMAISCVRSLM